MSFVKRYDGLYILFSNRINVITDIEKISFESSSIRVKLWRTYKSKQCLPGNNRLFKLDQKQHFAP
jgi:hypothetical protein